jgi:hypothetical protein
MALFSSFPRFVVDLCVWNKGVIRRVRRAGSRVTVAQQGPARQWEAAEPPPKLTVAAWFNTSDLPLPFLAQLPM